MAKIESDVTLTPFMKDLVTNLEGTEPAADELRVALNAIVAKYKLHASVTLSILARLSAAYIYLTQQYYNKKDADEVVEEDFYNMLTAQLTDYDMSALKEEIVKIKDMELN